MTHITTGLITSLLVFILVMQVNVSRTVLEDENNEISEFECQTDNDCYRENTYCDINLNLCSQCLNCSIYFRKFNKNINCAKDVFNCSICLEGYKEEIFFGGEKRESCITDQIMLPIPAKISSKYYWQDIGIIIIIILFLLSLLWIYFHKRIHNLNSNYLSNNLPHSVQNLPPSYDSCMKLENYVTDDVQEFHLFTGEQPPRNEWRHQNAVPFRLLEDSQETNNCVNEIENVEEIDGIIRREIDDPEVYEEETMPSAWIPHPPAPPPTPPPASPVFMVFQSNNVQNCTPPLKRIKLSHGSTDMSR